MEHWTDQGIVLSARGHGESGAVLSVLTENHGRYNGYVHGARSSKMRGLLEAGTILELDWKSRVADQLGYFAFDQGRNAASLLLDDPVRLAALLSACALCDVALPEREGHPGLYHGLLALIDTLPSEIWGAAYVLWEIALLKELGFGLDMTRCVAGGDPATLAFVSPKSGCAVSFKEGFPYRDRLLALPDFLKPVPSGEWGDAEIVKGLALTGYFLKHRAFAHHAHGVPEARLRLEALFSRKADPVLVSEGIGGR